MRSKRICFCICALVVLAPPFVAAESHITRVPGTEAHSHDGDIAEISSVWHNFLAAAAAAALANDKEAALLFVNPKERDNNREAFDSMGAYFQSYVSEMGEIKPIEIGDDFALYVQSPRCDEADQSMCRSYPIYFINCLELGWLIHRL